MPGAVLAQSGSPAWNSTIYYYNPQDRTGSMGITFTGEGATPPDQLDMPVLPHAFGQVSVGSTGDFKGAAMLSADVPLVAVYKQYDAGGGAYAPVLYSSFDATQSSVDGKFYLPSVQHAGYYVSKVGIQNVENETVDLTLHFIDAAGAEKVALERTIDSQASLIFQILDDASNVPGIGSSFDGSLVIEAVKASDGVTPARVVAAVEDLQSQGQRSYAYEGSGATATAFYLPYASCKYSTGSQTTTFFVQNAGPTDATIKVYYYTTGGTLITSYTPAAKVKAGARMLVSACDAKVLSKMSGKNGTARITGDQPLVVMGKATSSIGLSTAFLGQPSGAKNILLPYVEYSKLATGARATISIMNVGLVSAKNVTINFWYKKADNSFGAQKLVLATTSSPLAKFGKYSATPKVSGAALDANGNYLGAAEVISDQPVVVVVRISQSVTGVPGITLLGEDYTGVPYITGP